MVLRRKERLVVVTLWDRHMGVVGSLVLVFPQTHRRFAQYYDPAVRRQTARVELGCEQFARDR